MIPLVLSIYFITYIQILQYQVISRYDEFSSNQFKSVQNEGFTVNLTEIPIELTEIPIESYRIDCNSVQISSKWFKMKGLQ